MSKKLKKVLAWMLVSAMLLGDNSVSIAAEATTEMVTEKHTEVQVQQPETAAPETQPATQAPETAAPETAAPETQAPETQAPETAAPETAAPETQAPETQAPETQAPETAAPETQAQETQAETAEPLTSAPETEAPSTDAQTEAAVRENVVTFHVSEGAVVTVDGKDVTNKTATAKDGKIIFTVTPNKNYKVVSVKVDGEKDVRSTGATGEYVIEGITTDATVVAVTAEKEEEETEPTLSSKTFDVGVSSIKITDDGSDFAVSYGGKEYKNVSTAGEIVLTGSTGSNTVEINTGRDVTIRLKNVTFNTNSSALKVNGNGRTDLILEGTNTVKVSNGAALEFSENRDLYINEDANRTGSLKAISANGSALNAKHLTLNAPVLADGSEGYADIVSASNLYRAYVNGMGSMAAYDASVTVEGNAYKNGTFKSVDGQLSFYVPAGHIEASVNGNVYEGYVNGTSTELTAKVETETEAVEDEEEMTEASTETALEETEAVEEITEAETETEATKKVYSYEDGQVRVTATLEDPAAIPDDAEFVVAPITTGPEYEAYMAALKAADDAAQSEEDSPINGEVETLLYDISFVEDGVVLEPASGSVNVVIEFKDNQLSEDLGAEAAEEIDVLHLPMTDEGQVTVENVNADATIADGSESVEFDANFFSAFAVRRAPAKAPTVGSPLTIDVSLSPAGNIESGDHYWIFVKAKRPQNSPWDNQNDIYYWQPLTANGTGTQINITSWKDQNGNTVNGAQLDPSQDIAVEVYNSPTGKTPGTAGFMSDMNNWSKVTEGGAVKNYNIHYGDKVETDNSITFPIELKAKEVSNDYDYLSILGPGVNYGISANYFNQTGHIQTNLAINNYSASAGNSQIEPNLTGAGGAVVIANSDAPEIRICSGMGDKGAMVALFYPESYSGKVTIDQAAQNSTVKVPSNGSKLKTDIVDPILRHGEEISGELLSHENVIVPSGQVIDTMAYPDDATIYIDGDAITDYEHLTINKKSGQMLIFNFDTTSSVSFKTYKVNVDGTGARSVTPNTAQGDTNTWLDNEVCRKIVFNCASCSSVNVNGSAGIFLLPRVDSSFKTDGTSTGWIISSGHVQAGGAEWHNGYGNMPDVTQAVLHFSKTVDGKLAKNYQKFVFKLDRYNASNGNWETVEEAATNNGSLLEMVINNMGNGYNAYRVTEYAVADGTPGAYTLVTDPIYVRVKYSVYANASGTAQVAVADTPDYFNGFKEGAFSAESGAGFSGQIEQPNKPTFKNKTVKVGLSITKTVEGKVDTSKIFKFEVTANQPKINEDTGAIEGTAPVAGVFDATIGSTTVQQEFDASGKAIVTLHAGEKITIEGLPSGTTYTIEEKDLPQGYTQKSATGASGTINNTNQSAEFVNTYHAEGDTVFRGVKTMEGRSFKDGDSITFKLEATYPTDAPMPKDSEGNVKDEVTINPNSGTSANFEFGEIKYTNEDLKGASSKVFKYKVTETCENDGVEVVTKTNTIEVTVTDDGAGKLTIAKKYSNGDQLNFANKFAPAKATLKATKEMEDWGKATSFTFTLAKAEGTPETTPMPASAIATATKDDTTAEWAELSFNAAGTYTYTITEKDDGIAGVTYNTDPHTVTVVVTRNTETNALSASVKYDGDGEDLHIENSFKRVTTHFEAEKSFNDWSKADSFTFVLAPVGTAPMPVVDGKALKTEEKTVTQNNIDAVFSDITYDTTGIYEYTITENNDHKDGVKYDGAEHHVKVVVTKKGGDGPDKNDMQVDVTYDGNKDLIITNTYKDTTAPIDASKNFNAWERFTKANADFHFTVTLTAKNSDVKDASGNVIMSPMPEDSTGNTKVMTVSKDSTVAHFGDIHFEKAGTYNYTIQETNDKVEGITYDVALHQVKVIVTRNETTNELTAVVDYDGNSSLILKNTFDSSSATLQASKTFTDAAGKSAWGKADSFTFKLEAIDKAPLPEQTTVTVTEGSTTGVFGEVEYKTAGTYKYTITEVDDHVDGVTYDTDPHTVTVTVAPDATGKLKATVKYDSVKDDLFIENEFKDTTAEIEATKIFNDWGKATNFTFTLTAKDGAPMPAGVEGTSMTGTAKSSAQTVNFGEIHYDKAGEYEYTITEQNDHVDGVAYDTAEHTVTVTVTKAEDNSLSAAVLYDGKDKPLKITNTYTSIKKPIEVTKDYPSWDNYPDAKFTFDLEAVGDAPLPAKTTVTATKDDALQSFGEIEFTESGVYNYKIKEQNGRLPGVTYDLTPHTVTVTVTADETTNALSATVVYDDTEGELKVQNTFEDTTAELKATKNFENWDKLPDDKCSFTFDLAAVTANAPMPEDGITAQSATQTSPDAVWAAIHYDKPGTYEYTITERNGGVDGVTYDITAHAVKVVVTQNTDTNKLTAAVTYDGNASLPVINTYKDTSAQFEVTKSFSDWGKASRFTFNLKVDPSRPAKTPDGDPLATPMPEKTTATATKASQTAQFGSITFEKAGTYYYIINEQDGHVGGVTYDTSDKHVVVTVTKTDDANNALTADVKYEGGSTLTVTNTFKSSKANIQAKKSFLDENGKSAWGKATAFEFNLTAGKSTTKDAEGNDVEGTSPMPAGTKDGKKSVTVTEKSATAMFGEISYDKEGTYRYTITETKGDADGVTYDTQAHPVTVTVSKDSETNELSAAVVYGNEGKSDLTITNTYKATSAKIYAEKLFADWGKADSFEFILTGKSGAPMPANNKATATKDNKKVDFGEIRFEKAGTYEYTITETKGDADGVTYDASAHNVTVTVTKDKKTNELSAVVTYADGDDAKITNTYTATEAEIKVQKDFDNWGKATEFTFDLAAVTEGAPMPTTTQVKATDGTAVSFGSITYEKTGVYEYTIKEQNGGVAGVSYDTAPKKVTVNVTKDDDNKMSATVTYSNTEANADADAQVVTNTFEAVKAPVEVTKVFSDWGKADSFTFNLTAQKADSPMPEKTQVVAKQGEETQSFGDITFEKDGTYVYYITEVNDGKDGVSYDTRDHKVLIQVTKANDATNKLTATVTYDDAETDLKVTNTYANVKTHMEVTKSFSDWGHAKQFDFVLAPDPDKKSVDADGKTIETPMPTTQDYEAHAIEAKKTGKFDDIVYEKAGTYYYTITEVKGDADGVTYDTEPHKVVVTVTKSNDEKNTLTAAITYDNGASSLTITNEYATSSATLQVKKQIDDWGTADHFDFVLTAGQSSVTDEDGNVLDSPMPAGAEDGKLTATATKTQTTAVFGKIDYEQTGTYKYTIKEVNGGADGVKYDTKTHDVVVTVTKDADNKMTATVKYDGEGSALTIDNEYKTVKTHFEVTKNFNDWNNSASTFTFDLAAVKAEDPNGKAITPIPMPSQTGASATTATGKKAVFGDIEYKQAGTYEYTITEKDGKGDGVKYDLTPHKVVVTVTKADDATNALTATVKYDDKDTLVVTNTYKSTKAEIKVEKDFADWGKATGFTFKLAAVTEGAPMPTTTSVTATESAKVQSFGQIEFKKTGEYKYTITEENGGEDGVSYDTTPKNVTVTVSKDADNQMTATVTYDKANAAGDAQLVKNTYASTSAEVEVTKDFADWGKADSFTFVLAPVTKNAPMPKDADGNTVTEATATQKVKLASFGEITFENAGVYEYTITERNDGADGVTYDTSAHKVVVTVTKANDATNKLTASVAYDDNTSLIVKNSYEATTAELKATKSFTEWGKADTFKFDLEAVSAEATDGTAIETVPMPAGAQNGKLTKDAIEANPTAIFGTIKYEKAGTYKYTITEQNSHVDGVTYDEKAHAVVVTVTKADDNTNKLTATVKYDDKDTLTITNTFESSKATLAVTKSFKDWGKADSFTFNLEAVNGAPLTDEDGKQIKTQVVATKENATQVFGTIAYDKAGVYEYTITEVNDGKDGVSYDITPHTATVTVAKNEATNVLTATVKYDVTETSKGTTDLTVTNTYKATKAYIEATKKFSDWGKADSFTFDLEAVDGAPMPPVAEDGKVSGTATEAEPTVNFGDITYEEAGDYKYTVTEQKGSADGVTYDTAAHEVTVHVTKANDATNKLFAEVDYGEAGKLEITNSYTTTEAEIKVRKEFADWGKANEFKFTLAAVTKGAPMPETTEVTATEEEATQTFGKITYEKTGTYQYTITEANGGKDGVTYDVTPKTVTVKVTKDADNKMSAAVTYTNGTDAEVITNTYESTTAQMEVTKSFNDWGKAKAFRFELKAVGDAPMPEADEDGKVIVTATEAEPTATFDEITYEKAGTYEYTITEINDGADGVSYDVTPKNVKVTVTKANDATNKLTATVSYAGATQLKVTNTYESTQAELKATKSFNDWGKAKSFRFNLKPVDGAPMPADAVKGVKEATATEATPEATFGKITYEKAGVYKYTITEVNDGADGVTYDSEEHEVVVTVTKADDNTNKLTATVTYDGGKSLTITNTYAGSTAKFYAKKVFTEDGADVWEKFPDAKFEFTLAPVDGAPMVGEDGKDITATAYATKEAATAAFDTIKFEKSGTYEYTITETDGGLDGVTYDTEAHKVTVVVSKDAQTNKLTTAVTYDDGESALEVENTFTSVKATLEATKDFADWGKADSFTFNLAAVSEDAPMPAQTSVQATEENPTAVFGEITYEAAGTYQYNITEEKGDADGVTYDTTPHRVVVYVNKGANNVLSTEVDYDPTNSDEEAEEHNALKIKNTYTTVDAEIKVEKEFEDWGKADAFEFTLAAVTEDAPMPEKTVVEATEKAPQASFGKITYEKTGTYTYTITETNGEADGVSYDIKPKTVTVEVTKDDDNKMSAAVSYTNGTDAEIITNTYEATTAELKVEKKFEDWGKADEFKFDLEAITADAPMPEETTVTATEDAKVATFGEITFEKAGTYEYTITEQNGGADGVSYDTSAHKVTVVVSKADDETNALTAEVTYDEGTDAQIITNTYASTTATLEATKSFTDWSKASEFKFDLEAIDGAPMPAEATDGKLTKTATEDAKKAVFGEITYEQAGVYKYTITEQNGGADGVTYDEVAHEVVVTVTKADDATNTLTADVKYDGKTKLIITNTYAGSSTTIQATKDFDDWGKAESFTFTLAPVGDAPMTKEDGTAVNPVFTITEDETTAVWGPIQYEATGKYEYTITETNDGVDGVSYDTKEHKVVVTVTKNAENKLSCDVKYDGGTSLVIENRYTSTSAELKVEKEFEDWGKADSFTFDLEAVDGAPMPTTAKDGKVTVTATQKAPVASFGEITYEQAGTYTYTITELNGGADGVSYDTEAHTVTVEVTNLGGDDNELEAVVTYDKGDDAQIITNTYKSTKAELKVEKEFTDWGKADEFKFDLEAKNGAPMPAEATDGKVTVTATEEAKVQTFGEITYEKAGTYEYTITELNGGADGVSYDTAAHTVTVEVTKADDATNALTATVTYDKGTDAQIITNSYASTTAELKVEKDFSDWGKADEFTFDLEAVGEAPLPAAAEDGKVTVTATEDAKVASFGTITYEQAGTYEYTITELNGGADGVSYDTTAHKVTVEVTKADDATNALTATVTYDKGTDAQIVTNTYAATTATLEATKSFTDWSKAEEFKFDLEAVDGAPMPAEAEDGKLTKTATEDAKTAVFGEITYEKAGTYKYTITEQNGGADGVTYDEKAHEVVVTVTKADDATNALTATVTYDGEKKLIITNTYAGSSTTIQATKDFNDWGKADSFTFTLAPVDGAPMVKEDGTEVNPVYTVTEDDDTAVWGPIKYEAAGTYEYTVTETNDGVDGVSYDTTAHKVVVKVTKDATTNKLTCAVTYDGGTSLVITNEFTATEAELKVEKDFADWGKADEFTFDLEAVDGAPMPEAAEDGKVTVKATENAKVASFGKITYDKAGTYEYTITEQNGGADGVTYDTEAHKVTVEVSKTDDEKNALSAVVTYDKGTDAQIITNTYAATTAELKVEKDFADWGKADEFKFDLEAVDGAPMPAAAEDGKVTVTATEDAKVATFGEITYEKAGTYEYTITEQNGGADGVTYDTEAHKVTVEVTKADDATNALTATVTYDKGTDAQIITNTYASTEAELKVEKKFEDWGKADEFEFTLAAVGDAPMPAAAEDGKVTVTATEDAKVQTFGEITYEKAGTYEYTITETNGGADGVSYDTTAHKVTVEVTKADDATNALTATVTYDEGTDAQIITNTYAATTATLEATKQFTDWSKAEEFKFDLEAIDGAPMPAEATDGKLTKTATEDAKTAVFGEITYEQAGTYKYTITEQNGGADGVTYDTEAHEVVVEVTKAEDATNALTATVTYDGGSKLIISNTYAGSSTLIQATKEFEDWGKADTFTFTLAPVDGAPMVKEDGTEVNPVYTVSEDDDTAAWGPIQYEKAGTYEYTITETNDGVDGVSYDTEAHKVVVTVSKEDGTNKLICDVTYDGEKSLVITNTFAATTASVEATKNLVGRSWKDTDKFEFELAAVTKDAPMPEVTVKEATKDEQTVTFGEMTYEKAGVYEYTITEKDGGVKNMTYDTTPHKVTVTVSKADDATNALKAEVTYEETELVVTNEFGPSAKISKVDVLDNSKELAGATLQVIDKDGKVVDEWISTTESHEVTGLEAGATYTLRETVAPDGYAITVDTTFTLDEFGEIDKDKTETKTSEEGTLLVEDTKTKIRVKKVDATGGEELDGAHIQIIDKDGKVVDEWDSKAGEAHEVEGLLVNTEYTLRETIAPEGYTITSDTTFTIDENGKIDKDKTTTTCDTDDVLLVEDTKTFVKIKKVDLGTGEELEGAHIQIIDKDGNVVEEWDSTKEAHEVHGLKVNEQYTLRETVAPDGYTITTDTTFEMDENGKIKKESTTTTCDTDDVLLVQDTKTKIRIKKVDIGTGEELDGAHIQILDKDGNVVDEWVSEAGKPHEVEGLKVNTEYTLRETVAPDGYEITTDTVFEMDENGKIIPERTTTTISDGGDLLVEDERRTADGEFQPTAKKVLKGATLKDGQFKFELKDESGKVLQTKANDASGNVTFDKIAYTFADAGKTFTYTVSEINDKQANMTYDESVYTATVKVVDNGTKKLDVEVTWTKDGKEVKAPEFVNEMKETETPHETETPKTPHKTPKTGDETPILPYTMLMFAAAAVIAALTDKKRRAGKN